MKMDELWRIIKHWWNVAILTRAAFLGLRGTSRTDVLCYFSLASHGTRGTILLWKPCDESLTSRRSLKWSLLCREETSVQKMHLSNHPLLANTHSQTDQMMSHTFFLEMDKKNPVTICLNGGMTTKTRGSSSANASCCCCCFSQPDDPWRAGHFITDYLR